MSHSQLRGIAGGHSQPKPNVIRVPSDAEMEAMAAQAVDLREQMEAPTDDEVERCLLDNGMPKSQSGAFRGTRGLKMFARKFYVDVQAAKRGDPEAMARVDQCREAWGRMQAKQTRAERATA